MTDPMQAEREADLHARIMNLPNEVDCYPTVRKDDSWRDGYSHGHRDVRYAAAELAAEHASDLRSLRDALALARSHIGELREALEALMELERRDRFMPIGREWDAARAALNKEQPLSLTEGKESQ